MNNRKPKNVGLVFADTVWEFTIHTPAIWDITTGKQLNCRVMLGGEIYYRAKGRPWGPAADFIVKFHLPLRDYSRLGYD
jgi:hypothetical protein